MPPNSLDNALAFSTAFSSIKDKAVVPISLIPPNCFVTSPNLSANIPAPIKALPKNPAGPDVNNEAVSNIPPIVFFIPS